MKTYVHDPQAILDYRWNWSAWAGTDQIVGHEIIAPPGVTIVEQTRDGAAVTAIIGPCASSPTPYTVTCRVQTVSGLSDDRSIRLLVRET